MRSNGFDEMRTGSFACNISRSKHCVSIFLISAARLDI